ncbi:MAG TPA: hypothetical protein VH415_04870 [Nitrososphaeraceae archaeon]|jgi:hypothetical protein
MLHVQLCQKEMPRKRRSAEPLENNERKKATQEFEKSEHEHSSNCGCES